MTAGGDRAATISVAVCTRNRPALLSRCLESLGGLRPAPLEILIVDQSDGDASARIAEQAALHLPGLRRLATPTRGLSRARNAALGEARGEIVAFTDDDCLVPADWVGRVAEAFERHPDVAAVTGGSLPDPARTPGRRILAATTWHPPEARLFRRKVDPSVVGGGLNLSIRKSWAARFGMFDPDLGPGGRFRGADDTDFIHRVLKSGGAILYDPDVVVFHLGWRDDESQTAVEFEYGHGIAAWALKMAAQGDFFPLGIALEVVASQGRRALGGILRRDRTAVRTGRAYLAGLGRGAVAWVFARGDGSERRAFAPKEIPHG
ncbi:MAG TPA: glycosyltransferase [Candidatus Polarisedimenticolia bacterium]|jgi:GT2 family glycosyltransferase|nr:glycosyltransferase [Candidatus Polarisedimenticolia bacterium]